MESLRELDSRCGRFPEIVDDKSLSSQVKKLEARSAAIEHLCGEILATLSIEQNREAWTGPDGAKYVSDLLKMVDRRWRPQYNGWCPDRLHTKE